MAKTSLKKEPEGPLLKELGELKEKIQPLLSRLHQVEKVLQKKQKKCKHTRKNSVMGIPTCADCGYPMAIVSSFPIEVEG